MPATRCPALVVALFLALPAAAQNAPYLDDRSDAAAVIRSYVNAINRSEPLRAWSYFDPDHAPEFESFRITLEQVVRLEARVGETVVEGAAGTIYASQPIIMRTEDPAGVVTVVAGCVILSMPQPGIQEVPPFEPLGLREFDVRPTDMPFEHGMGVCEQD